MLATNNKSTKITKIIDNILSTATDSEPIFIVNQINWIEYENVLNYLADSPFFRVVYNQGILQIISPSSRHEIYKKILGMLVENYCLETGIRFYPLGSTTLKSENVAKKIEPDQCYCFDSKKDIPDLAIEVVITSGGVNTLEIYQGLGVAEVWFWQNEKLSLYYLQNGEYFQGEKSQLFPKLDLNLLSKYVKYDEPFDAILEFRNELRVI